MIALLTNQGSQQSQLDGRPNILLQLFTTGGTIFLLNIRFYLLFCVYLVYADWFFWLSLQIAICLKLEFWKGTLEGIHNIVIYATIFSSIENCT